MNGRVAQLTLAAAWQFLARNRRAVLLVLCCMMSLTLLGAVRAREQVRREALPPVAEAPMAEWNDGTAPLGALNDEPEQTLLVSPQLPPDARPAKFTPPPLPSPSPALPLSMPAGGPKVRQMLMEVTAYCACKRCCGPRAQGLTASGRRINYNGGRFVAADTRVLKFNTQLLIPGYAGGRPVEVIDRGGAIKGNKLDVFFDSHEAARKWGRQWLVVTVLED
jgi:3D (Asp-Asp-Asp) domain-containing protein